MRTLSENEQANWSAREWAAHDKARIKKMRNPEFWTKVNDPAKSRYGYLTREKQNQHARELTEQGYIVTVVC